MGAPVSPLSRTVRLADLTRGPVRLEVAPDAAERSRIAEALDLEGLPELKAQVEVRPWLDGAEIVGRFEASATRICGVSLEPFEERACGDIDVRVVPAGSPNAPQDDSGELSLDPDAPDPPDELEGDVVDVGAYVVEHLALELAPFPRKPGVEFDYAPEDRPPSPFAALARLKREGD